MYTEKGEKLPDGRIEVVVRDPSTGQEIVRYYSQGAEPKVALGDLLLDGGFLREELLPKGVVKKPDLAPLATKEEVKATTKDLLSRSDIIDGEKIKRELLPTTSNDGGGGSQSDGLQALVEDIMLPEGTRDGDIGRIGLAIIQKQDTGKPLFRVVGKDVKTFFCERIPFDTSFLGRVDPETDEALKKDPDAKKIAFRRLDFFQEIYCVTYKPKGENGVCTIVYDTNFGYSFKGDKFQGQKKITPSNVVKNTLDTKVHALESVISSAFYGGGQSYNEQEGRYPPLNATIVEILKSPETLIKSIVRQEAARLENKFYSIFKALMEDLKGAKPLYPEYFSSPREMFDNVCREDDELRQFVDRMD